MLKTSSALVVLLAAIAIVGSAFAQSAGAAVQIVVTVEGHKGTAPPEITGADVMVYENNHRQRVTNLVPLRDDRGGLQLWLLIDDGTDTSLGSQLDDLRKFVRDQPSTTQIGIGYLRNGTVETIQALTADHDRAAKAIRLPFGTPGISASPYLALIDLIHRWPDTSQAREVVLITSGIDPDYGPGPSNPYLSRAIDTAQRAGVVVYSIYFGSAGHAGHSYWQINWGQNYLSQLGDETGGEFYWQGASNPVSFAPYLSEISQRLKDQYLLTFEAAAEGKAGFQAIKLKTEIPHVTLVGPSKVYVGAGK
jgi:hypothetical protein